MDAFTLGSTTKNISYYLRIVVIFQTVGLYIILSGCKKQSSEQFITARCYASAVLATALCLSVSVSVRHKSEFY